MEKVQWQQQQHDGGDEVEQGEAAALAKTRVEMRRERVRAPVVREDRRHRKGGRGGMAARCGAGRDGMGGLMWRGCEGGVGEGAVTGRRCKGPTAILFGDGKGSLAR